MSLKVSVFIATSLDGFIARSDGELDWLDEANETVPEGEDCGYNSFMESVEVLVMGRNTYEKVLSFGKWPYAQKRVIVLSTAIIKIPAELSKTVSCSSETPEELYERLRNDGLKHIYIDGGNTINRFLSEGLLDDITITLIPILLGSGISLFGSKYKNIPLKHISTKTFDFGFVQLHYEVEKES